MLTFYAEVEHLLDGFAVAVEGGARHGQSAAHFGACPPLVELVQGDASGASDGLRQPDVLFEYFGSFHGVFSVFSFQYLFLQR